MSYNFLSTIIVISDKWVNYLEMSKRGDFNPSSNYYFWYLDLQKLVASILDHFYKAIFNLRLRSVTVMSE